MAKLVDLTITRLLQNPLGGIAPDGHRGDIVRVSDGVDSVYLDPDELDLASEGALRAMLDEAAMRKATSGPVAVREPDPRVNKPPAAGSRAAA